MNSPTRFILTILTVLSAGSGAAASSDASQKKPDIAASLHKLTTGSVAERIEAAEQIDNLFPHLQDDPSGLSEAELVTQLIDAMGQETDDWVTRTMLESLASDWNTELPRLFQAALESPSPNVRAMALHWYMAFSAPDSLEALENLWEDGVPPWARLDLMQALLEQGSTRFVNNYIELARDAGTSQRVRAIRALSNLSGDEETANKIVSALAAFSGENNPRIAATAIETLAHFNESDIALDAVLAATNSGPRLQAAAVEALASFRQDGSSERLIALLEDPESSPVHRAAARSLEDSHSDGATGALVDRLRTAFAQGETDLASDIEQVLRRRNDPDALPGLRAIRPEEADSGDDDGPAQGLRDLIAFLDPDGEPEHSRTITITSSCSLEIVDLSDMLRIVPAPGHRTVRCWERPGFAGESWDSGRIPAGVLFTPEEHFDRNGETWVSIDAPGADDCWVPERLTGPGEKGDAPARDSFPEIDLPAAAVRMALTRKLLASGAISTFDEEDAVVGVVIRIDPKDPRYVRWADEMLDMEVDLDEEIDNQGDPDQPDTETTP